jgi:hypothetical protein
MIKKELPMALASPFFGKREPEPAPAPYSPNSGRNLNGTLKTEPVNNLTQTGLRGEAVAPTTPTTTTTSASVVQSTAGSESGSRLIVGPNIKLKGVEITDCDTLVVEGHHGLPRHTNHGEWRFQRLRRYRYCRNPRPI